MKTWIKGNRHQDQPKILRTLRAKLVGHYRYYGVTDNYEKMRQFYLLTMKMMWKWWNRRSQRRSLTWERFNTILHVLKLPKPRIYVNIYG